MPSSDSSGLLALAEHLWIGQPIYYLPDGTKIHGLFYRQDEYIVHYSRRDPIYLIEE